MFGLGSCRKNGKTTDKFRKQNEKPTQPNRICHTSKRTNVIKLIQNNLKWDSNVNDIVERANGKLHMLRLLKRHYLPHEDLITVYRSYIRPICEYGCPVWNGGLTTKLSNSLESIQKRALRIIFGNRYST